MRDIILGREKENPDIDFALKKGAINFGRQLSRIIRGGFVVLDKENGCSRVVKKKGNKTYTLDFTDFRGRDLEEDLRLRDFTINTLALDLGAKEGKGQLIDICGGLEDIKSKLIRMVQSRAFSDDPLRILRAFSLAAIFGFKIDKRTQRAIELKKKKIRGVSPERIRDEVFKILATPCSWEYIRDLNKYKILELIFPEIRPMQKLRQGPYHHLDVWGHSLETLKNLELVFRFFKRNTQICSYLDSDISSGRKRKELLKLAALLHDIGKPKTMRLEKGKLKFYGHESVGSRMIRDIGQRLKLSNEEIRILRQITFCHLRPGYLADLSPVTPRAKFRFFRDTGSDAVSILLISLADQRATKGALTTPQSRRKHERLIHNFIKFYFLEQKAGKPSRIINGDDLIKNFKLSPSPLVGKVLKELEELQAIGKIKSKKEGLSRASKILGQGAYKNK